MLLGGRAYVDRKLGLEKLSRVGLSWASKDFFCLTLFNDLAVTHDCHIVRKRSYGIEVVRDE
jgi:hypothetical protein